MRNIVKYIQTNLKYKDNKWKGRGALKNDRIKILQNLSLLSYIGIMIAVPIIGAVYIGNYLNNRFRTGNALLIVCILIGVGVGFLNVYKILIRDIDKRSK